MIIQRTELKYLFPLTLYNDLRKALDPFMEKDPYIKKEMSSYNVNSVYYDTPGFKYYYDKIGGEELRKKFRVRYYGEDSDLKQNCWVEIKLKNGQFIKKHRDQTVLGKLDKYLSGSTKLEDNNLYSYFMDQLKPVVCVRYRREPLVGIYDSSVRITFDYNIRAANVLRDVLNISNHECLLLPANMMLLEIKIMDQIPTWLSRIVERFNLDVSAYSKYAKAIENCDILRRARGDQYEL